VNIKVLVTGGRGFLGTQIVKELAQRGYRVRVVDYRVGTGFDDPCDGFVEYAQLDLRDRADANLAFAGCDVCVALAARCGGIGFFNRLPAEILDDNARILSASFNAARSERLRRIIYVSSSCVFDGSSARPAVESDVDSDPAPPAGYPFSKLVGEHYCKAYAEQFALDYTILRPFNAYGPGEMPGLTAGESHVIPDLATKLLRGEIPLRIFGDGSQTRSFTHVSDIARGVVLALEDSHAINEDFNLGHPREISILQLAQMLWRICGRTEPFSLQSVGSFEDDVQRRAVNISKARDVLGWEPHVDLESGLIETVNWLKLYSAISAVTS
jgi:nucleoside-diphosphate-sugar epimerase